ncbi:MAG: TldD/PmbA family protein [DPANN group archaeon]|nr:TldD/PmbA family protein [DPANN group archaeon]
MKKVMAYLLKELRKLGDDVIIDGTVSDDMQVKFSNSEIVGTYTWHHASISVFVNFGKRLVSTALNEPTLSKARRLIKKIAALARTAPENKEFVGIARGPFTYKPIRDGYDPLIARQDPSLIEDVVDALRYAKSRSIKRTAGVLETSSFQHSILSSADVDVQEKGTIIYFTLRAFKNKEASGHHGGFARLRAGIDFRKIVDVAADIALKAGKPRNIPPGTYDVLFTPLAAASILMHVGNAASAFSVESGQSPYHDTLGKRVAGKAVTLYDDGTLKGGYHSSSFDEEGRPTQRTKMIDKGMLRTFLHNTSTAARFKARPTGNAGIISPESTNIVLSPGKRSPEELLRSMKRGLYITNVWYTRFQNYHTGDFSTIPRDAAFLIEDGRIKHSVRNIRISENLLNIMKNLAETGNDPQPIIGWEAETPCVTPHVLIRKVNITRPTK